MKKSQLRNIIRESIKGLNEQSQNIPGTYCVVEKCSQSATHGNFCVPNSNNPALGSAYEITQTYSTGGFWSVGTKFFIKEVTSASCNAFQNGVQTQLSPYNGTCFLCCQNPWQGYPTQHNTAQSTGACWNACPGQATGCTQSDFTTHSSPCGTTHLSHPSYQNWLNARWNGYNNIGCQHLQSVINWITQQLASGVTGQGVPLTPLQITRKNAKIDWAGCMQTQCSC